MCLLHYANCTLTSSAMSSCIAHFEWQIQIKIFLLFQNDKNTKFLNVFRKIGEVTQTESQSSFIPFQMRSMFFQSKAMHCDWKHAVLLELRTIFTLQLANLLFVGWNNSDFSFQHGVSSQKIAKSFCSKNLNGISMENLSVCSWFSTQTQNAKKITRTNDAVSIQNCQIAITVWQVTPWLCQCSPKSIFQALIKCQEAHKFLKNQQINIGLWCLDATIWKVLLDDELRTSSSIQNNAT